MKLVVFGANGRVGSLVVAELLKRGHSVRAFTHGRSTFPPHPKLEIFSGDIYDADSVYRAVLSTDAVVSALGSWGTPKKDILTVGMQHIIPAMQKHGVKRLVSLTGTDSNAPGDTRSVIHSLTRGLFGLFFSKILIDGEAHIRLLAATELEWTVVRSPVMNSHGKADAFNLTTHRPAPWHATINRQSVAQAMTDLAENREFLQAAPYIHRR